MKFTLLFFFILIACNCFSQVFKGKSQSNDTCYLKINPDNSLDFISYLSGRGYVEYKGSIIKVNGNIYAITWDRVFQSGWVWSGNGKNQNYSFISLSPDLDFSKSLGILRVSYLGKRQVILQMPPYNVQIAYDNKHNLKNNFLTIESGHIAPIFNTALVLKVPIGLNVYFQKGNEKESFRVIWNQGSIRMINDEPFAFGLMELKQVSH